MVEVIPKYQSNQGNPIKFILTLTSSLHILGTYFFLEWLPGGPLFIFSLSIFGLNLVLCLALIRKPHVKKVHSPKLKHHVEDQTSDTNKVGLRRRKVGNRLTTNQHEERLSNHLDYRKQQPFKRSIYILDIVIQFILTLMMLDFTFTSWLLDVNDDLSFSRVTWVNSSSAHIFWRLPKSPFIKMAYKKSSSEGWNYLDLDPTTPESDYTSILSLAGLEPSTTYHLRFILSGTESYLRDGIIPKPLNGKEYTFTTSPVPFTSTKLYFAVGSCIKPNFPYNPFKRNAVDGFKALNQFGFEYLVFLGDFIYADTPFYFGPSVKAYRQLYRRIYAIPEVRSLAERIPILHAYDDHEILNNWDQGDTFPYQNAITAFVEYQGSGPYLSSDTHNNLETSFYGMVYGDIGFYFWDTRRFRSSETGKDGPGKTMLGELQKERFKRWILETQSQVKVRFIVSSVPLTYNWVIFDAVRDTWKGYQYERQELLEFLAPINNVFFLSGDRHEVSIANLPFNKLEFSLSPINQFYGPLQFYEAQGASPTFDPTLLYYRHGTIKFGGFLVDTQSRADGRPVMAISIYSNMPGYLDSNHFDPSVLKVNLSLDPLEKYKLPASNGAKVVFNFNYLEEPALQEYLDTHVFAKGPASWVTPIMHLFWLGESN